MYTFLRWEKWSTSRPNISTTRGVVMENSSDSSLGRRPDSKSNEFSVTTPLVVEIISILVEIARRLCYHLLGFEVQLAC